MGGHWCLGWPVAVVWAGGGMVAAATVAAQVVEEMVKAGQAAPRSGYLRRAI